MKVRLTGIMEETVQPVNPGEPQQKIVIARFESPDLPPYYAFVMPAQTVPDAKIGDEFEVFIERVRN